MQKYSLTSLIKARLTVTLLAALVTAFVIMLLAPRTRSFPYVLVENKPWNYDLVTAPYDFPIYKSSEQLQLEQDSIRQSILPVYTIDDKVLTSKLSLLNERYKNELTGAVPEAYIHFLQSQLKAYYEGGIMQAPRLNELRARQSLEVNILGDRNILRRTPITQFYSLKEVYDLIFENAAKQGLDREQIQRVGIASLLAENVHYNKEYTDKLIEDGIDNLSTSTGLIQKGERIIDRGEIVTPYIYNVLSSLRQEEIHRTGSETSSVFNLGQFLYTFILLVLLSIYLSLFYKRFLEQPKNLILLLVTTFIFVSLTELQASTGWFPVQVLPYVMMLLLLRIFFGSHLALTSYLVTILISAYFVPEPLAFIFIQITAGFSALFSLQSLTSRGQLIRAVFSVYVAYILSSMAIEWIHNESITSGYWIQLLHYGINLIFLMFTYILASIVETIFGYVSNIRLVELADTNNKLLQELSEQAPGTFQHSYQVSILATAAATAIGADAQLIRTGALYHDIGKILHPEYFTENSPANNPHLHLSHHESARVIIRHVLDGVTLAQKHGLPDSVIDLIRTHHGRSTTRYFYNSYCNEHPGEWVDPEPFTYPGPNPFTREQGILMLADSVEAASRSLSEYTEEGIRKLIDKLIDGIVSEGLLNDTPLTFRDIKSIKEVFYTKLKTMYHARIAYPDKK